MNQEVRKFLINKAHNGKTATYKEVAKILNLNTENIADRNRLGDEIGDISAYEYEHGRPLLSAIVIYSNINSSTEYHGDGFYSLCENLEIGSKSSLKKTDFGMKQMTACLNYWKQDSNIDAFFETQTNHSLEFFKPIEIDFFSNWVGKVYDKSSEEHISAKNFIMNSLGTKTQYWSNMIVDRIDGLDTFNWRMWSQKGWSDDEKSGKKIPVAKFKPYTWARIYRDGDDKKDIFFTVGVDGERKSLVYKLDFYFEGNSYLDEEQKKIIAANIPNELRWNEIPIDSLDEYNWDQLLGKTILFIKENLVYYDKLIEVAWGKSEPKEVFKNFIRKQQRPESNLKDLPNLNPSFKGENKDFVKESINNKDLGDTGEQLVVENEIRILKEAGYENLSKQVKTVKDGNGYDVLSFDIEGNEKYIEVKTTRGRSLTPFYYTINELLFAKQNPESYSIYRLYNYDEESNTADYYIIDDLESILMQEMTFKVYLKKKE